jgi:hypothetical protein
MKIRNNTCRNLYEILMRLGQRALYVMPSKIKDCVVSSVVSEAADNKLPLYTEHGNINSRELSILLYLLLARQNFTK